MKHHYLIVFTILILIFTACNNTPINNLIPNKSILEPLTKEEFSKISHLDEEFNECCEELKSYRDQLTENDKKAFKKITYRDLFEYTQYTSNDSIRDKIENELREKWELKFSKYTKEVDNRMDYWKNYDEKNSLNKYVKIEFKEIKEIRDELYPIRKKRLGIKVTPLVKGIDCFNFHFWCHSMNIFNHTFNKKLDKPTIIYLDCDLPDNITKKIFEERFSFNYRIEEIKINGETFSIKKIPNYEFELYTVKCSDDSSSYEWQRDEYIKKYVYENYKRWTYFYQEEFANYVMDKIPSMKGTWFEDLFFI